MRRLSLLVVLLLVVPACSGAGSAASTSRAGATTTTVDPPATSTSTIATTTTMAHAGPPLAWIAPSGVVLAVTGVDGETVHVITPCGDPADITDGTPVYDVDVVIDPGHGGPIDTGAVAPTGVPEKEINLTVGLEVARILNERGVATVVTRSGDYPIPIPTRSEYADSMGAKALVSIHHNAPAAPASDTPGTEIFIQDGSDDSRRLGGLIYQSVTERLGAFDVDWDRAPDAGVMTVLNPEGDDAYGMIRIPDSVSVLVELGYVANRAEAEFFARPDYAPTVGAAVADAIEAFLNSDAPGTGFVDGRVFDPQRGVGKDQCIEPDLEASLYPDVVGVEVSGGGGVYGFDVTVSSPYDTPERYADGWRVIGDDGVVYATNELTHDHATEQPFTRSVIGVSIPSSVETVVVQARDQTYGWGGATVTVTLP